jgi:two-component system CheB/CheR fusion protein
VNIPIVMVSRDLRIRRFTPLAEKMFNLIPSDIGRPIDNIKPDLKMTDLADRISRVIDSLLPHESEVQDLAGRSYSIRIRPYVTLDSKIDGASVVLIDIDSISNPARAQARAPARHSREEKTGRVPPGNTESPADGGSSE